MLGMAALVPACGGGGSFTPATEPADVCALLMQADAQTILPTAGPGMRQVNARTDTYWSIECAWWESPGQSPKVVSLLLDGALTSEGARGLDDALTVPVFGAQPVAVSGLGDNAAYADDGTNQTLGARAGNFMVNVTAYTITPAVTESQLRPLVAKAIAAL